MLTSYTQNFNIWDLEVGQKSSLLLLNSRIVEKALGYA